MHEGKTIQKKKKGREKKKATITTSTDRNTPSRAKPTVENSLKTKLNVKRKRNEGNTIMQQHTQKRDTSLSLFPLTVWADKCGLQCAASECEPYLEVLLFYFLCAFCILCWIEKCHAANVLFNKCHRRCRRRRRYCCCSRLIHSFHILCSMYSINLI